MKIKTKFKRIQQDNNNQQNQSGTFLDQSSQSTQFKHCPINTQSLKSNNFPALGYYNPDIKKQYVPKSSLQNPKLMKTANRIKQLKKQLFQCQDITIRNILKPIQEKKNPRKKKEFINLSLEEEKNIKKLDRSESTEKYLPKSIRQIEDIFNLFKKNPSKSMPKKINNKYASNDYGLKNSQQEKIKLSPISITKKQFHRKYNSLELQKYEQQQTILSQFTQNKLREIKQKQSSDDFFINQINIKKLQERSNQNKYLKPFHQSIDLDKSKKEKKNSKFRQTKNFYFTPWKQDNDNQDFFSRVLL